MAGRAISIFREKFRSGKFEINDSDVQLFLEAVKEVVETHDDIQELLQDMREEGESCRINLELITPPFWTAFIKIENGEFETGWKKLDNPTLTIKTTKEILIGIVQSKVSLHDAFSQGNLQIEGDIFRAAGLGVIFSALAGELGLF